MLFSGQLTLDLSGSNFDILSIKVYDAFDVLLLLGENHARSVSFANNAGTYVFVMEADPSISGVYHAKIMCDSLLTTGYLIRTIGDSAKKETHEMDIEYILLSVIAPLILCVCVCIGFYLCCAYKESKKEEEQTIENQLQLESKDNVYIEGDAFIGENVLDIDNVYIEGDAFIGENVLDIDNVYIEG
eukprot:386949_1